ncbi:FemAB family PEP-CTERM system-associated protein [Catenovulum sp. SM1970]|nr:FemAB family PEP-CTERM system-associated protein [Marinifaba aquimaris]
MEVKLLTPDLEAEWDDYVKQHPLASAYHLTAWKKAVEFGYGHTCFYWLALRDNKIVGVLPTAWMKNWLSKGSLCALPFCDLGGVIADDEDTKVSLVNQALVFINQKGINRFDNRASLSKDIPLAGEYEVAPKVRMLMPFPETSAELLASFKSKLRSQINKAKKNGLTAEVGRDQAFLDGFYQVFTRNMRDLGSPVHSKKWFEQILHAYGDNAIIANVYAEGKVVGAGIVLFCGDKACIPWASTNADYNRLAPNMLLYWTLLEFSNDRGCKEFDFGRSTLGEGTYRFKSQWGAKPSLLDWKSFQADGQVIEEKPGQKGKARELVEQTWRKLPVGLSEFLGPKIRKHISL